MEAWKKYLLVALVVVVVLAVAGHNEYSDKSCPGRKVDVKQIEQMARNFTA